MSTSLVLSQFEDIRPVDIREIIPNQPIVISVKKENEDYNLRVTAMDASHCPGSIMILFEKMDSEEIIVHRTLYTGDFRFDDGTSLERISALHGDDKRILKIDELYLDTTFMKERYKTFPGRKMGEQKIWELVKNWVGQNKLKQRGRKKEYVVLLHPPARYGYENVLNNIYLRSSLEWRVHVPAIKFNTYLCHTSLNDCTDEDPDIARFVHACAARSSLIEHCKNELPCRENNRNLSVLHIKPSAMWFTSDKLEEGHCRQVFGAGDTKRSECLKYRVCYSTHASLSETEAFVKYFKPKKIVPCVLSQDDEEKKAMFDLIDNIMKTYDVSKKEESKEATTDDEEYGDSCELISVEKRKFPLKRQLPENVVDIQERGDVTPKRVRSDENLNLFLEETAQKKDKSQCDVTLEPKRDESSDDSLNLLLEETPEKTEEEGENLDDTPDIEDIIASAERDNLPDYVMKSLREEQRRMQRISEDVIVID